jgi:uncharacterized protein YukE
MADDIRIRNIPQALIDAQSLTAAANKMRDSKHTLETQTAGALAESSGQAVDEYRSLFAQYLAAFERQIDVRDRLATVVYQIIEDNQARDQRIASSFSSGVA